MIGADSRWETVALKLRKSFDEALSALTVRVQTGELDLDSCVLAGDDVYIESTVTPHGLWEAGYGIPDWALREKRTFPNLTTEPQLGRNDA